MPAWALGTWSCGRALTSIFENAQASPGAYQQPDQQELGPPAQEALSSLGAAARLLARLASANPALAVGLAQVRLPLGGGREEPDLVSLTAGALGALSALPAASATAHHTRNAILAVAGGLLSAETIHHTRGSLSPAPVKPCADPFEGILGGFLPKQHSQSSEL